MKIHSRLVEVLMMHFLVWQRTLHFLCAETPDIWENNCWAQGFGMSILFFHFSRHRSQASGWWVCFYKSEGKWGRYRLCLYAHFWVQLPIEGNDPEVTNHAQCQQWTLRIKRGDIKVIVPSFLALSPALWLSIFLAFLPNPLFSFLWSCGLRAGLTG